MRNFYCQILAISTALTFVGCGQTSTPSQQESNAPKQISGQQASSPWGSLTNSTNLTSQKAIVYIDRVVKPGQVAFNAGCLDPLKDSLELGTAICAQDQSIRVPILAKNVEQRCLADLSFQNIAAKEIITDSRCSQWNLVPHAFNPALSFAVVTNQ
jgi:hypothetical protein